MWFQIGCVDLTAFRATLQDMSCSHSSAWRNNNNNNNNNNGKGKAVPLQAWSDTEGSRKLRFPDFMTTAQDGGKVVSLTHRKPLPPGNVPGTRFCLRLSRPQGHGAVLCQ